MLIPGADQRFFLGGGALVSCSTSTPINHIFFFCRIPVVLENRRSSQGGRRGAHPLHPPPRSAPVIRYLKRALIEILQQVQNGIDSDCTFFRLENLIDLLLRSAHLYQDGGTGFSGSS